jgi:tRNA G46 methylase TrmB
VNLLPRHPIDHAWGDFQDWMVRLVRGKLALPPRRLRDVGGGYSLDDFEATGHEFVAYCKDLCQLQASEEVLEIGCGCGRIAIPLATYMGDHGRFYGVEIVEDAVLWCANHITRQHPNFRFFHADLYNQRYNNQHIYYGSWTGRKDGLSFQDIIVARK